MDTSGRPMTISLDLFLFSAVTCTSAWMTQYRVNTPPGPTRNEYSSLAASRRLPTSFTLFTQSWNDGVSHTCAGTCLSPSSRGWVHLASFLSTCAIRSAIEVDTVSLPSLASFSIFDDWNASALPHSALPVAAHRPNSAKFFSSSEVSNQKRIRSENWNTFSSHSSSLLSFGGTKITPFSKPFCSSASRASFSCFELVQRIQIDLFQESGKASFGFLKMGKVAILCSQTLMI
mmetsp:Transcript_12328/g.18176  ORF Transcript_12328/g.18176 Transcript_12328/m.18176 type:complete len:232 (-) Transcript_12328:24-719(-)